ncbi:hypothetical protein HHK36_028453 [Tetracentron sinense]|uniref:Uncharacterized protein n=1 Tax=Tetracentron sinense TaxID=13715 RepID=A0A834YBD5_TETSI|nr:hypothetical protein HHK36_028453 [Tetracentron sinense]
MEDLGDEQQPRTRSVMSEPNPDDVDLLGEDDVIHDPAGNDDENGPSDQEDSADSIITESFRDVDNVLHDWIDSPSSDYCVWRGVTYDNVTFNVIALDLKGNRLSGQIPDEIGECSSLKSLDLSFNGIYGDIPLSISKLQQLESLYLHGNKLTSSIPPELRNMTKLHYLELNDNQLSGHIPPELGKLTDLFDLNVTNNNLEGPILDNLSSCTNLNSLNVEANKLNGSIPYAFVRLESMAYMYKVSIEVQDSQRSAWLTSFNDKASQIFGRLANELNELLHKENGDELLDIFISRIIWKQHLFIIRGRQSTYENSRIQGLTVIASKPVDFIEEIQFMLHEITLGSAACRLMF